MGGSISKGESMLLAEWQCPKKDHPIMAGHGTPSAPDSTTETSPRVLIDPPPEGQVWVCWQCQTPLVRLRDYPIRNVPLPTRQPAMPAAPVVADASGTAL